MSGVHGVLRRPYSLPLGSLHPSLQVKAMCRGRYLRNLDAGH